MVEGTHTEKKKWLAWTLAVFLPGFGHIYLGHWKKGLAFFIPALVVALMFVTRVPYSSLTGWVAQLYASGSFLVLSAIWVYHLADAMDLLRMIGRPLIGVRTERD